MALGLEHAAAWIKAQWSAGFDDYLRQWDENEAEILESFELELIEYPTELLVTWNLSVNQLDESTRRLLDIFSWLAPEPVPEFFLESAPEDIRSTLNQSMAALAKYSLLSRVEDPQRRFQIHRLVQATSRWHQRNQDGMPLPALDASLEWMGQAFVGNPQNFRNWLTLDPLAAHVGNIAEFAVEIGKVGHGWCTTTLINQLGLLYRFQARYADAEVLYEQALSIDENSYGADHPSVSVRLNNLGQLFKETHRFSEAEPQIRRALSIAKKNYGEAHPMVATRLNNLAILLQAMDRMEEVEPLLRGALAIDKKNYGEEHPNIARGLNNLAQLFKATNRLSDAEPLMRRALEIDEKSFGVDHPSVAIDLNNLAHLFKATNRMSDAEPLMRRVVEIFHAFEGSTRHQHPQMDAAIGNYGSLLMEMGLSKDEAIERIRELLANPQGR